MFGLAGRQRRAILVGALLLACSCQAAAMGWKPEEPAPTPSRPAPDTRECRGDRAARFMGMVADARVRAELSRAVGRTAVRWIAPGQPVTLDYSPVRLNVILDESARIMTLRCG